MNKMLKPFGSLLDRIICVVMAVLVAQFPVYVDQYIDVLSGARMEAKKAYDDLQTQLGPQASARGMTVEDYVAEGTRSADPMVKSLSTVSDNTLTRYKSYEEAFEALSSANILEKPFTLSKHYDTSIHNAIQFEASVPLTWEGAAYGIVGILLGLLLMGFLRWVWRKIFGKPSKNFYLKD